MSIEGVELIDLKVNRDNRGSLTKIYDQWDSNMDLLQWNLVRSGANVLRGLHVHLNYDEYYVPVAGKMFFGLVDLRRDSGSFLQTESFHWSGKDQVLVVPNGVLHGVYCKEDYILTYGLSRQYDGSGEFGCIYDDLEVGIVWPTKDPILSEKDKTAGSFVEMLQAFEAAGSKSIRE